MFRRLLDMLDSLRNFLLRLFNREFLIFLFFLVLSATFWLLMSLNETYERDVRMTLNLTDVPKNVILTSDSVATLNVTVKDKGYWLLAYIYGHGLRPIKVSFNKYGKETGLGLVQASELHRLACQQLSNSAQVEGIKPDKFEYYYNFGVSKRVPVRVYGKITPSRSYYISRMATLPDSVDIYASREVLDSTRSVNTERIHFKDVTDTIVMEVPLQRVKGVKYVPDKVKVSVYPDVLTEKTLDVPITAVNMPANRTLRTFPSKVKVTFTVESRSFRDISPDNFSAEVDYDEIRDSGQDKCTVHLRTIPSGVREPRMNVTQVDYLIEER